MKLTKASADIFLRGLAQADRGRAGAKIQQNFMRPRKKISSEPNTPSPSAIAPLRQRTLLVADQS